jgi:hypothetical protein
MGLKQIIAKEKQEMSPIRFQMNYVLLPVYLAVVLLSITAIVSIGIASEDNAALIPWVILPLGVFVAATVTILAIGGFVVKKEIEIECERWKFVWEDKEPFEGDELETVDVETGIKFSVDQCGVKIIFPQKTETVFAEVEENVKYVPWEDARLILATDNYLRRVRLAIAMADVSARSVDGEYEPTIDDVYFLPLCPNLSALVRTFGVEERIAPEWHYLQYNPRDAVKQILSRGYIRKMKAKKGDCLQLKNDKLIIEKEEKTNFVGGRD